MKKRLLTIIVISFMCSFSYASDAIIVVANIKINTIKLSKQEVRNLFMGSQLPYQLTAIALPPNNQTRVMFNTKVVGLTESRIQSYWAQMRFSGRRTAPKQVKNEIMALEYLMNNIGTITYLPSSMTIPSNLTILLEIK